MATKKQVDPIELVNSHKPKNFKFCYVIHDNELLATLMDQKYDLDELDTVANPELLYAAKNAVYEWHDRADVAKAKEPTVLNNGVLLSKKMATKADKKLLSYVVSGYNTMHLSMGYDGEKKVSIARDSIDTMNFIIDWCEHRMQGAAA